ncbi:MATE family efflux transporter, partial [Prevotella copri]|uniref:MATE family efflux transporter n=1 Tax=Segatella copri TaxID=165179 RepID=UPI001C387CD5
VPLIIFCIFRYFLEGIGNTRAVMVIVISSNVINILLNYLLIYGRCGFPEMRAEGAGLATLISRILMVIIILIYFSGGVLRKYIKGFSIYSISKEYITRILKIGFPIALQMTMEGSTFAISGIIIGVFGEKVLAANQIAIIIGNLSFLLISAISSATTITISQTKGLKDFQKTIEMTTNSYIVIVCINIITIIVLYLCRKYIVSFFTTDIEVKTIAAQFVIYVCVYQLSDGIQGISMGVLRGFQDVKIIPVISLIVYFVISIPIGCVFAFVMSCGYNGLWYGYIIGLTLAAIYFYIRVKRDIRQIAYY